jgi:peptidoglycan/xylan/chitin deacetylase (PgdA/CDA1 family)
VLVEIARAFPDAVFFKETSAPVVALTIDDVPAAGPDGDEATRVILAAIAAWNATIADADRRVAATFFVISDHLVDGSTILADIAAGGHEIGNHGEADATAATLSRADFVRQLQASHDRLVRFTDQPIRWYRPGRGLFTPAMTEALRAFPGYEPRFALASMLPVDTFQPADDPGFTAWYVGRHVFPGAILVLHGGTLAQSRQTAAALRLILPELARRGYRVVTLSRLWGLS